MIATQMGRQQCFLFCSFLAHYGQGQFQCRQHKQLTGRHQNACGQSQCLATAAQAKILCQIYERNGQDCSSGALRTAKSYECIPGCHHANRVTWAKLLDIQPLYVSLLVTSASMHMVRWNLCRRWGVEYILWQLLLSMGRPACLFGVQNGGESVKSVSIESFADVCRRPVASINCTENSNKLEECLLCMLCHECTLPSSAFVFLLTYHV